MNKHVFCRKNLSSVPNCIICEKNSHNLYKKIGRKNFIRWVFGVFCCFFRIFYINDPSDTGSKLDIRKTFRSRPGGLLDVLSAFGLPVSRRDTMITKKRKLAFHQGMSVLQLYMLKCITNLPFTLFSKLRWCACRRLPDGL